VVPNRHVPDVPNVIGSLVTESHGLAPLPGNQPPVPM